MNADNPRGGIRPGVEALKNSAFDITMVHRPVGVSLYPCGAGA